MVGISVAGPWRIIGDGFGYQNRMWTYSFNGTFTSETTASGTYTFSQYFIGLNGFLSQSGTWTASYQEVPPVITLTAPNGGENWEAGMTKNITWTTQGTMGNVKIELSSNGGSTYSVIVNSCANSGSYPWVIPNSPSSDCWIRIRGIDGSAYDVSDAPFAISAPTKPIIHLNRNVLDFGSCSGNTTAVQRVLVSNSGAGMLNWTAFPRSTWISAVPGTGAGLGTVQIDVKAAGLGSGINKATVEFSDQNAINSPQTITINLRVYDGTNAPIGVVDTPTEGTTGIEGSVPVTGWAVDDIEVVSVKIYRELVGGEGAEPNAYVYIGDAVFVEGARPDVEQAYPTYPMNYRAGWGYMMLTNFLPNGGNGTFRLHAIATDKEGNTTLLGSKTITCDNTNATLPFGAIDVPSQQGEGMASGSSYINFAWVLATKPKCIPADGSTITAWVDSLPIGHPSYGYYRVDIATLFPGYCNANGAIGYIPIDTTKYTNGMHTLAWSATDSAGVNNGFGSRYFTIQNSGAAAAPGVVFETAEKAPERFSLIDRETSREPGKTSSEIFAPMYVRRGFDLNGSTDAVYPNENGSLSVEIRELERVEIYINPEDSPESIASLRISSAESEKNTTASPLKKEESYLAYQVVGDELRPLPIGSTFDAERGIFYWQPGPGFIGQYDFIVLSNEIGTFRKIPFKIIIKPTFER